MVFWNKKADEPKDTAENFKQEVRKDTPAKPIDEPSVILNSLSAEDSTKQSTDAISSRFGKIRSALGIGTVIQGKLNFDTPVRIDGKLSGEIYSSRALIVGPSGIVDAKVEVAELIVMGSVKGDIKASERIEVHATGKLEGKMSSPIFVMEEGAQLAGSCQFHSEKVAVKSDAKSPEIKVPIVTSAAGKEAPIGHSETTGDAESKQVNTEVRVH